MSSSRRKTNHAPVVLVFGESINDSASVGELLVAVNPDLSGQVRARPRPASLTRTANPPAVRKWVDEIRRVVVATEAAGTPVRAVVVHRDGDGPDPGGTVERELAGQLSALDGRPVVPVQAIEAWWFLFPGAVEAVRPQAWRNRLPRNPRDVEMIQEPKAELQRLTRRGRSTEYCEADSPAIARNIRELSALRRCGSSASFERFLTMASTL